MIIAGVLAGTALGFFYELKGIYFWINELLFIGAVPSLLKTQARNQKEYQRFRDACLYMEQMLYAFKKKPKILTALEEVESFFPKGEMHDCIREARFYLRKGECRQDIFREALEIIGHPYENTRLVRIHRYFAQAENYGGEYEASLDLLIDDLSLFTLRVFQLQKEKRAVRNRIWIAFAISVFICGIGTHFLPQGYSIGGNRVVQTAAVIMVCLNLAALTKATRKLTTNWLKREKEGQEKQILRYYHKAVSESGHGIGKNIACRRAKKEIEKAFPGWLMELALYLRNGNVQRAIERSIQTGPIILKEPLKELSKKLKICPSQIHPYLEFLKEFDLPQVQSAMKMLYGISESGGEDSQGQRQIQALLRQNTELMNRSEQMQNEDAVAGMSLLTLFPMITGSAKLLFDMVIFIIVFLGNLEL